MRKLIRNIIFLGTITMFFLLVNNIRTDADDSFSANTDAVISFIDDSDPNNPVDPTDPSKPDNGNNDDNNHQTDNSGTLTLDVAPIKFDFGSNTTSNNSMKINAKASGDKNLQYLQVSDKRTSEDGWDLNVSQTKEFTSDDGKVMTGANITIPKGDTRSSHSDDPTSTDVEWLKSNSVTTALNSDQTIFSSDSSTDAGKGVSTNTWNANNVTLNIPRFTSKKGSFSSQLKWSLVAGAE